MDKNRKIVIIVGLVLIAALCVTAGVLSANYSNNKPQLTTVTNTPTLTNTPTTDNTDNSDKTKIEVTITLEEAMKIVDKELSPYYNATSAYLTSGSPNPVYVVHIIHTDPNHSDYVKDGGNVTVDAVTGFVEHKGI